MIRVTVLNENTAGKRGFLAEHGLSLLVETTGRSGLRGTTDTAEMAGTEAAAVTEKPRRWLFDTGQTDVFLKNADRMGVDLLQIDGIILSHGHFDHCGGMEYLVKRYREAGAVLPPVYVRERAFLDKTAVNHDKITYRHIGIPWKRELISAAVHPTADKERIADRTWVLGNIPYTVEFETRQELFFIGEGEQRKTDYMDDEQMFLLETGRGLAVFAGCCHAGIINCLKYVRESFPEQSICSVFAGMHLFEAGEERVAKTMDELAQMELELLVPAHCTGLEAIGRMKNRFGTRCRLVETGTVFDIG